MDASINKQNNSNVVGHSFNAASNILDIGLAREIHLIELQNIQAFIAHKEHEVSVYENARRLIECQAPGDRCMVFLADNLFVMRTREQALEILDRQIEAFQTALKYLRQEMTSLTEKVALMERLNITNDGLVEIREPENEDKEGSGKIKGKRIQHSPTKKSPPSPNKSSSKPCSKNDEMDRINDEIDQILKNGDGNNEDDNKINEKSKEDNTKPTRPKGVSEKDYERFVKLCDSLELSEDEEEKIDENGEEMDVKEGEEENNQHSKQERRRVHFSDILEDDEQQPIGMKKNPSSCVE